MNEPGKHQDHGAPGPSGAPQQPADEDFEEVTDIADSLEREHRARRPRPEPDDAELDALEQDAAEPAADPYFYAAQEGETGETAALRPLSEVVVQPFTPAPIDESIVMEPTTDDRTLHEAILTKRLPQPPKHEVTMEEIESVVAEIPEAGGSDTEIRSVLPQSRVMHDPGLLFADEDVEDLYGKLQGGLLLSLSRVMSDRIHTLLGASGGVPYDLDYYSLRGVGKDASIVESPSLLEAAFLARVTRDEDISAWAVAALMHKCRQHGGIFHDIAGVPIETPPGRGCAVAIRDVTLAFDWLSAKLSDEERSEVMLVLHTNGVRLYALISNPNADVAPSLSEAGAMSLGLAGLPLMNEDAYYQNARRWVDSAEQRAQALLLNRVAPNGRPAASDLAGLAELMRFLLPFCQAFQRYYGDDMLMGEGGNLSLLPGWLAQQFGSSRTGLFSSGRMSLDDLRSATPLLAKLADTYRDGVAQWLLQQVSVARAASRASAEERLSSKYRLELPAEAGIDSVLSAVFYDPRLRAVSPEGTLTPGARLSDTRAVVRSAWDSSSPIVTLQAEAGVLPNIHLATSGLNLTLHSDTELFEGIGGSSVISRVRDYIDLGGAAYVNGDFKGTDGSLAQRHLLYLRAENTALLFDRFDIGDGRSPRRTGLRVRGSDNAVALDRGTLAVHATDGTGRQARFTFFSNGISAGVESRDPGLGIEFMRGRGDLVSVAALGKPEEMPDVRRINAEERGRVYRTTLGDGAVLFNGWQGGMPQQCGWIWTDALMAFVDRRDDYPGRYVAVKATSVLAYDMHEGIHLGFGACHPDDPDKPVEFSLCASGPQAVLYLSTRAQLRVSFPGLKKVLVDGTDYEIEGESKVFVLNRTLEPGRHLIEFEHESPGPESAIVTPREDQLIGGAFTLHASIGDPIGVESARLLVDGRPYGEVLNKGPWFWKLDVRSLSEGSHEAVIEATDVLGNTRRSDVRHFRVDNTPPTVRLEAPEDGRKARGVLRFAAKAQDPNGVDRVQFCLNGRKLGEPVSTPPYVRDIDTSDMPDGEYHATAIAFDSAGNVGQSAPARLVLTNNAPPPAMVKLKIMPPVLAVEPLSEVQLQTIGIDDEGNEQPVRVQWRRLKGLGVVDRKNIFTAPGGEGPCVMEAQIAGTTIRAKLHAVVSKD
jgi:hypothetical protein